MTQLLAAAFIGNDGTGHLVRSFSADGAAWTTSRIPQESEASPALAVLDRDLWVVFRGKGNNTTIYAAALSDWGGNKPTGQSSRLAPSATVFGGKLWVAYIGEASGNVELVSSPDGVSWSPRPVDTGQSSKFAPSVTVFDNQLWVAFIGEAENAVKLLASPTGSANSWTKFDTGQSSKFAPSVTAFDNQLWVAFNGEAESAVKLLASPNGSANSWTKFDTGQSSKLAPSVTAFDNQLWVAFIGEAENAVKLLASANRSANSWTKFDTGQASQLPPSVAVIDAAASISDLGGNNQYVFWSSAPLKDLVVEIAVTKTLQVSPRSGVTPSSPVPRPVGFQINCFSPNVHETAGDKTVGWQQYGVRMWPGTKTLVGFSESWPVALETNRRLPNTFQVSSQQYNGSVVTLPNDLTIPAGWTIRLAFNQQGDGTVAGFNCTVTDTKTKTVVGPDIGISLAGLPVLAAGGNISESDLAQIVAFQVVLVGFWSGDQSTLVSGAGTITCSSSTPMRVGTSWPTNSNGNFGTAEFANSNYGPIPAHSSTSITQTFGVIPINPAVASIGGNGDFVVTGSGLFPNDKLSFSYTLLGTGSGASESGNATATAASDGSFFCTIQPPNYPGPEFAPGTTVGFSVIVRDQHNDFVAASCQVVNGSITRFAQGESGVGIP